VQAFDSGFQGLDNPALDNGCQCAGLERVKDDRRTKSAAESGREHVLKRGADIHVDVVSRASVDKANVLPDPLVTTIGGIAGKAAKKVCGAYKSASAGLEFSRLQELKTDVTGGLSHMVGSVVEVGNLDEAALIVLRSLLKQALVLTAHNPACGPEQT
jgi:hypothetical protein